MGTGGLVFNTTDGGITWKEQTTPTKATLSSIHFFNDTVGYAVGDSAVVLSFDSSKLTSAEFRKSPKEQILVYPNPFVDNLQVTWRGKEFRKTTIVQIVDIQGSVIRQRVLSDQTDGITFELGNVSKGIYVLRIQQEGKLVDTRKIITR